MLSKKLPLRILGGLLVLPAIALLGHEARAADVDVTASVVGPCTLTAEALAFGNYVNGQANPRNGDADVSYDCASGLNITLNLSAGGSLDENNRRMEHTTQAGNFLTYQLYQEVGRTTVWGSGANGVVVNPTPGGGAQVHTIFGQIAGTQGVVAGSYSDLVVFDLTINS
jgi:spore coat protein U-like protein